jgi:hypothetical protein
MQDFLARQVEAFVLDEKVLAVSDRAADRGFPDAIGFADGFLSTVFPPVHQHHEPTVFQTEFGRASEGGPSPHEGVPHQSKGWFRDAGEPFELFRGIVFDVSVEHIQRYETDLPYV